MARIGGLVTLSLILLAPSRVGAHPVPFNYAWVGSASADSVPSASYRYHTLDLGIFSRRTAVGRYEVTFYGLAAAYDLYGHAQVTAYDGAPRQCQLEGWWTDTVTVLCFDMSGNPADSRFTVQFFKEERHMNGVSWVWADSPSAPSYTPDGTYAHNDASFGAITITRLGTGVYDVVFGSVSTVDGEPPHVQVSAYGTTPAHCKVDSHLTDGARVRCFDPSGSPVDSRFALLRLSLDHTFQDISYGHLDAPASASPYLVSTSAPGGWMRSQRQGLGDYQVESHLFGNALVDLGTVMVTAHGSGDAWCKVASWLAPYVYVRCFDSTGAPADSEFELLWKITNREPFNQEYAYGGPNTPTADGYIPPPNLFHNAGRGGMVFDRAGVGLYTAHYPGMEDVGSDGGVVLISNFSGDKHCKPVGWNATAANVACFDTVTGAPADSYYDLLYWKPTEGTPGVAYAWANQSTTASYAPPSNYSHNPSGGAITVDRLATGHYSVTWDGYGETIDNARAFTGVPIVSAYGSSSHRCNTGPIHVDGDTIEVYCFDVGGSPVDTLFVALYVKSDYRFEGVAYSWAHLATTASYLPLYEYHFNPALPEEIEHTTYFIGSDRYYATLFPDLRVMNHEDKTVHVQVSTNEPTAKHCGFYTRTGFPMMLQHFDCLDPATGSHTSARYHVLALKPSMAPEPSTGVLLGSGVLILIGLARRRARFGG